MNSVLQLTIRFLLELAAVAAAFIVGASVGSPPFGLLGGLALAGAFVVVWGLFLAPRARVPQTADVRLIAGTLVMVAAAIGLALVGPTTAGAALAAVTLVNAILIKVSGASAEDLSMGKR